MGLDAIVAASTVVGAGRMAVAVFRAGSIVWSSDAARTRTAQSLSASAAVSVGSAAARWYFASAPMMAPRATYVGSRSAVRYAAASASAAPARGSAHDRVVRPEMIQ